MPEKQLPAKKTNDLARITLFTVMVFLVYAPILFLFFWMALSSLLAGDLIAGVALAVGFLFFLWSTGGLFVGLGLNLYFHSKYRSERANFAQMDLVHRKALKALKKMPFSRHISVAVSISNLGILRLCQGDYEGAASLFSDASDYLDQFRKHRKLTAGGLRLLWMDIILQNNLASAYIRSGKLIEAELIASRSLETAQEASFQKKYKMLEAAPLSVIGAVHTRLALSDSAADARLALSESALEHFKKALEIFENEPVPKPFNAGTFQQAKYHCCIGAAIVSIRLERKAESLAWYEKSVQLARRDLSQLNVLALEGLYILANEYMNNKIFDIAEELLDLAYKIAHDHPFHPDSKQVLNYYEKLLLLTNRQSEVQDMRSWLRPLGCRRIESR